jgi:hypothetical protein
MSVIVPRGDWGVPGPCWIHVVSYKENKLQKPVIKCQCGMVFGMGNHKVGKDGVVSPSWWHNENGCGWHVSITLKDWYGVEFPVG